MDPKEEAGQLLDETMALVEQHLSDAGTFYPFATLVTVDDEHQVLHVMDFEEDEPVLPEDPVAELQEAVRQTIAAGGIKVVALVYDVTITDPEGVQSDAVELSLHHSDGYSVEVLIPYSFENGELLFGEALAQSTDEQYFEVGVEEG